MSIYGNTFTNMTHTSFEYNVNDKILIIFFDYGIEKYVHDARYRSEKKSNYTTCNVKQHKTNMYHV